MKKQSGGVRRMKQRDNVRRMKQRGGVGSLMQMSYQKRIMSQKKFKPLKTIMVKMSHSLRASQSKKNQN